MKMLSNSCASFLPARIRILNRNTAWLSSLWVLCLRVQGIVHKKQKLEKDPKLSATEKRDQMKQLTMDGCPIEDLGLDFTLPGYPNIGKLRISVR